MSELGNKYTAQNMIRVHGLRAQALVHERIAESRLQGDSTGLQRWQDVEAAISELRRTGAKLPRVAMNGWGGRDRTSV
jgi:hypothetical protein